MKIINRQNVTFLNNTEVLVNHVPWKLGVFLHNMNIHIAEFGVLSSL